MGLSRTPNPVIQVSHIRKSYGATAAVSDVSFDVSEGEVFGLIGPNGAGKTTTMECVEGLRRPDRGTISVPGLEAVRDRCLPQVHRLPHLDALLELGLLVLHADPLAEGRGLADGLQAQDRDRA